jgi:hypothetical protein
MEAHEHDQDPESAGAEDERTDLDEQLARVAERQHGAFTRAVADEVGFGRRQRARRIELGRWEEPFEGVYRIAGVPKTWRSNLYCAVLAGYEGTVASHRSASAIYEIPGADRCLQELLSRRWGRVHWPTLVVHETLRLDPEDVTVVDSIPVTTVERTLLDLGAVRSAATVERAVETALRRELTTIDDLVATIDRLGRRGRRGLRILRSVIDARTPNRDVTESDMEMRLLQVLRANGLPEPVTQFEVWDRGRFIARVDAAYIEWRIALEYDSYLWHSNRSERARDNERRNALMNADWFPISVIWDDVQAGGARLCQQIVDRAQRFAA